MTIEEREKVLEKQWAWLQQHEDDVDQTAYEQGCDAFREAARQYEVAVTMKKYAAIFTGGTT